MSLNEMSLHKIFSVLVAKTESITASKVAATYVFSSPFVF